MSNEHLIRAANTIRAELEATETSFDTMLAHAGRLATALSTARLETGVGFKVGQAALDHVTAALATIVTARKQLVQAHRACAMEGQVMLPTIAWGDDGDCPPASGMSDEQPLPRLRVVEA